MSESFAFEETHQETYHNQMIFHKLETCDFVSLIFIDSSQIKLEQVGNYGENVVVVLLMNHHFWGHYAVSFHWRCRIG